MFYNCLKDKRCLYLLNNASKFSLEHLLGNGRSIPAHHKNIYVLVVEMYHLINSSTLRLIKEVFQLRKTSLFTIEQREYKNNGNKNTITQEQLQ